MTEMTTPSFSLAQFVRLTGHIGIVYRIVAGGWDFERSMWYYRIKNVDDPKFGGTFPESMLEEVDD